MKDWQPASSIAELFPKTTGQNIGSDLKPQDEVRASGAPPNVSVEHSNAKFSKADLQVIGAVIGLVLMVFGCWRLSKWEPSAPSPTAADFSFLTQSASSNKVEHVPPQSLLQKAEYDRTNPYAYRPPALAVETIEAAQKELYTSQPTSGGALGDFQPASGDADIRNRAIEQHDQERKAEEMRQIKDRLRAQGIPEGAYFESAAEMVWKESRRVRAIRLVEAGKTNEAWEELRGTQK